MATDLPILFPSFPKRGVAIRYAPVQGRKMTPVKRSNEVKEWIEFYLYYLFRYY